MTPGVLVGQAIGDALGMPFEKLHDEVHPGLATWDGSFQPGDFHKLPAGHWTDDTEMAEALAVSLIRRTGFDGDDASRSYHFWITGTPHGTGGSVRAAMERLGRGISWKDSGVTFDNPHTVGSGTAMRAAPLGVFYRNDRKQRMMACYRDAHITHRHWEAVAASYAVASAVAMAALRSTVLTHDINPAPDGIRILEYAVACLESDSLDIRDTVLREKLEMIQGALSDRVEPAAVVDRALGRRGNSWQVTASALYCACFYDDFRSGVTAAVKLGGDADTRGAIAGAVLGARFGLEGIPDEYKAGVLKFQHLAKLDKELLEASLS